MVDIEFADCEAGEDEDSKCVHYEVCKKRLDIEQELKNAFYIIKKKRRIIDVGRSEVEEKKEENKKLKEIGTLTVSFESDCEDYKEEE